MIVRIENVNEENEVYGDPVEITFVPNKQWASLNNAVHNAIATLSEFPNDSVRISVVTT